MNLTNEFLEALKNFATEVSLQLDKGYGQFEVGNAGQKLQECILALQSANAEKNQSATKTERSAKA